MISDNILTRLQDDVFAVLANTPGLADACILVDNAGDIENAVARALQNLTLANGKRGLAVIIMLPEITQAQKNLPGPPMLGKLELQVIEQVLINRDAANGTLVRSSVAALRVLGALHLQLLGDLLLYGDTEPVKPLPVKAGHVSHVVSLHYRLDQVLLTQKCADVAASVGTPVSGVTPVTLTCATAGASIYYTTDGSYPAPTHAAALVYATPIGLLSTDVGKTFRSAAYAADCNPGNALEFIITA